MSIVGIESCPKSGTAEFDASDSGYDRSARFLVGLAVAGIAGSILLLVGTSLVAPSWMAPKLTMPANGPPWELAAVRVPYRVVTVATWLAALVGTAGLAAGLAAARKGTRFRPGAVLAAGLLAVAVFTVLPPVGSSDVLDYAAYGRIAELGRSPYLTAPYQLREIDPAYGRAVPQEWEHQVSLYGPLATAEQYAAARLGGGSAARIVFWLKLYNAIAFGAVAFLADRLLRGDPVARLRAHLLWTVNPLLLWGLIAAAHIDVLAAALGLAGLLIAGVRPLEAAGPPPAGQRPLPPGPARRAGLMRAGAAGLLIGAAADIKIFYLLFGLGLAWSMRRQVGAVAVAAGGVLVVLVPTYAWFGPPAVQALLVRRNRTTGDSFYRLFTGPTGFLAAHVALVAAIAAVILALLVLAKLPDGLPGIPAMAVRPALALSAGWLFSWSYQLPWYDAMVICLLIVCPASRLDWLVLARLAAATTALMPGNPRLPPGRVLGMLAHVSQVVGAPIVLLAAPVALAVLLLSGRMLPRRAPSARVSRTAAATAIVSRKSPVST